MENSSRLLRRGRHQGILDGRGEEACLLKSCSHVHVSSEHSLFSLLYKSIFLHHSCSTLLHSCNLHLLDWMRLGGRRGGEGIEVVSDFVIQKLLALQ